MAVDSTLRNDLRRTAGMHDEGIESPQRSEMSTCLHARAHGFDDPALSATSPMTSSCFLPHASRSSIATTNNETKRQSIYLSIPEAAQKIRGGERREGASQIHKTLNTRYGLLTYPEHKKGKR